MAITDISDIAVNQRVSVIAKVVSVSFPKEITKDSVCLFLKKLPRMTELFRCRTVK